MADPTRAEIQRVANIARALEIVHIGLAYRMIEGRGPKTTFERCAAILCFAEDHGVVPDEAEVTRILREMVRPGPQEPYISHT